MVVYTMTKKQLIRIALAILGVIAAIVIIIIALSGSITASADERKLPIYCVDRGDNKIALTFDCAWGNSNTDALLEILAAANAKATFFVTGEFCDKYPSDVKKLYDAGHSVQNHSDTHPHVKGMNINTLIADTNSCANKIKAITGCAPTLYRAPYGEYDDSLILTLEGMGYKIIQWSVDSIDWEDPSPDEIKKRVLNKTESGSILLFHNDLENTEEALPALLTTLLQKGYEFVKAEDLIFSDSYHIDANGKQIYEPNRNVIAYANEAVLSSAFEKIRQNLTLAQIYELSTTKKLELFPTIRNFLSAEEIYAIQTASYEQLVDAYYSLVSAAENYGAGGAPAVTEPNKPSPEVSPEISDETADDSYGSPYDDPYNDEPYLSETPSTYITDSNNNNGFYNQYRPNNGLTPSGEESKG